MNQLQSADAAVIGGGIIGLATAYHLARRGRKVVLFERNTGAVGASVRNFGLLWPIGQPPGVAYERALRSRETWRELARAAGFGLHENGSLHLAYAADEWAVLEEFAATAAGNGYGGCGLLSPRAALEKSPGVQAAGLRGALWSPSEMTVDPREAVAALPAYLAGKFGVTFRFGTAVNGIDFPGIRTRDERWRVGEVYVCGGADFETLYPEVFAGLPLTRCKLQMMRTAPQPGGWRLGPTLCGGLTLRHYAAFRHCPSLASLHERVRREQPWVDQWGIHVMVTQNGAGELVIGDSHEYGLCPSPFDQPAIDQRILEYLVTFARVPDLRIAQRWHGVYPKPTNGATELVLHPEPGVTMINGLGGAGMTLSFGLAEEVIAGTYAPPEGGFQTK
ncbi:MAG: putative secreted oxidoreductase [uncultured Cytophagales bacterium]|uniref:Putative secreted oxidoreductase n=1 Tax=uncultured Cytophagales bacterium TaxID=158755 RepID=A0A6J4IP86_9SPHI|nr:MAG: putative secreted oxidoreductase [uncultured Cytophagales bacterium]